MKDKAKCIPLLLLFILSLFLAGPVWAHASKSWRALLDSHTAKMWVDAQVLGDLVLNARAEMDVTWLPSSLRKKLEKDRDVYDWVSNSLGYYFDSHSKSKGRLKGHDVFVLRYRAVKNWTFDPTQLVIGGHQVTSEDILTDKAFHVIGDLPTGTTGILALRAPSLKPGSRINISLGEDATVFGAPLR
ncbi:MAG: hypothetical protein GX256_05630 [Fretibacterium sp.]|nr:hypothetical protein [Fretibacterium sp.]